MLEIDTKRTYEAAYAIVRVASYFKVGSSNTPEERIIKIKCVLRDRDEANREMDRLNKRHGGTGVHYCVEPTRILNSQVEESENE